MKEIVRQGSYQITAEKTWGESEIRERIEHGIPRVSATVVVKVGKDLIQEGKILLDGASDDDESPETEPFVEAPEKPDSD